jgi:hypothetical protein
MVRSNKKQQTTNKASCCLIANSFVLHLRNISHLNKISLSTYYLPLYTYDNIHFFSHS